MRNQIKSTVNIMECFAFQFLVKDEVRLKWSPVDKVKEQLQEKEADKCKNRLHPIAFLLLNLLYSIYR